MKRRWAALCLGVLTGIISFSAVASEFSVLQGMTDNTSSEFSVVFQQPANVTFAAQVAGREEILAPVKLRMESRPFSPFKVAKFRFAGLDAQVHYDLLIQDGSGQVIERRRFRALDLQRKRVRIALVSCAAGYLYRSELWQQLLRSEPDIIFYLGDFVYADRPNLLVKRRADPKRLWRAYVDGRTTYDVFAAPKLIPSLAIWDDHDYGGDQEDSTYPFARESRETFDAFWAQASTGSAARDVGPGIASSLDAFGQRFLFLDGRTFREPENANPRRQWGPEQEHWLATKLRSTTAPVWLISGQQFLGGYRGQNSIESEFPQEWARLLSELRLRNSLTSFISGDLHYSELTKIEKELFGFHSLEITSSSMHSVTFPGIHKLFHNPRRLVATSAHNFVVLELEAVTDGGLMGRATSIGASKVRFSEPFLLGKF